jgi:dCMP deaminase
MDICKVITQRSTCVRIQTAAIIVQNRNVISMGYNGSRPSEQHCSDFWRKADTTSDQFLRDHHIWANEHELHAERNAILNLNGVSAVGATMYCIYSPCLLCAIAIKEAGITKLVFSEIYKRDISGLEFFEDNDISFEKIE